jgi:glutathione S-transferase
MEFLGLLDVALKNHHYVAGDRYSVADITAMISVDFMKPAKLTLPDGMANVKRWHAEVAARPSAKA